MQYTAQFILMLLTLSLGSSIVGADDCSGSGIAKTIVVDKSGGGQFTSVQSAIDSIQSGNNQWIKIQINPGVYVEKVTIPKDKPCIVLQGQGQKHVTITFNEHDRTDKSATFTSFADNIVAKGITFKNSFNHPLLLELTPRENSIPGVVPAVAARILGDKSAFFQCAFLGLQDTLWSTLGRHYFSSCYIEGAADFIFGKGQAFFEDCSINATAGQLSPKIHYGYITAQKRESSNDPNGFVFKGGVLGGPISVYLGRAWGPYSRVIFHETTFDLNVVPAGWDAWTFKGHEENFTYAEVNCKGRGSDTSKRVSWEKKLNPDQIQQFSLSSFINQDGWVNRLPIK